jgi:glycosyltransferase involved in cell wall biosynthesis
MKSLATGPPFGSKGRMRGAMGSDDGAPSASSPQAGPRVLHVIPTAIGRGAPIFARVLVDELGGPEKGHRLVSLFDGDDDVKVDGHLRLPGGAPAASGLHPRALGALVRRLGRFEYDVVVAHGGDAFKYLALATRAPIVYCVIGTWPATAHGRARRWVWTALARRARVAVAVSDDVASHYCDVLSLRSDRVTVIPNGRNEHQYEAPATAAPTPTTTRRVRLLFAGALTPGKGPDRFVDIVRALRDRGSDVDGTIVGDGPLRSALTPDAAEAGVELVGWCADVVPHLQRADLLVFPSRPDGEGMPGVLIEAGLCGLPAVATRVAGASTVIEEGRTGFVVPVDDFDALLNACEVLVRDPARRQDMGRAARDRCLQRFTLGEVAHRWDELLCDVAAARGSAPARRATTMPR